MELFCYQAECGDAIRLRYIGDDGHPHNIFLDSGYERTYRNILRQEINALIRTGESIDLWIVSHIHDDHIGGIMKYIKSVEDEEIKDITKVWLYNPPRQYPVDFDIKQNTTSSAMSIDQGDRLFKFLSANNKLSPKDIDTDLEFSNFFGLKIHILSPNKSVIKALRNKYKSGIPFQSSEIDDVSHAASVTNYDYNKKIDEFALDVFSEDDSLENKSSISVLIEYQNKKILWLADSHPSVVIESLTQNGYSMKYPLVCNYVILSHHASKRNNSTSLFNMIKCDKYIISSNGENKHCLPNKEVIAKIIRNKNRNSSIPYSLFFTYNTLNLKNIFKSDDDDIFKKWNFNPVYSSKYCTHIKL
jgi:hypothetical protein